MMMIIVMMMTLMMTVVMKITPDRERVPHDGSQG
jgi:hypothetical protein